MSVVSIVGAGKAYGPRTLWTGLDLQVQAGEMVAVTGPSGCGKSTLLSCIAGLTRLDHGSIRTGTTEVDPRRARRMRLLRRDTVGFLFQDYALVEDATVLQNLALSRGTAETLLRRRALRATVEHALAQVGLAGRATDPVNVLSGGERQRVALAGLIVKRPAVVLADEPTGALDAANTTLVVSHLRNLAAQGAAVVVATHDRTVESACDRAVDLARAGAHAPA